MGGSCCPVWRCVWAFSPTTRSVAHGLWSERDSLLIQLVDELHETATLSDEVWEQLVANWSSAQILEMMIIVGWYHLISFVANVVQVEQESLATRFPNTSKDRYR